MRVVLLRSTLTAAILATALSAPTAAQFPPDSFVNLQVLPKDLDWNGLIPIMAGFTRALGVRCTFCHVGEEGQPLSAYDFPSDEKLTKRKAREMLRMVRAINGGHLQNLEERKEPRIEVECATCHRGTNEPRMLQDVLRQAHGAGGIDSAVATYRALKARYYGRFTYDFSEVPLADVAGELGTQGAYADADVLFALNVEEHPNSRFAKRQHARAAVLRSFAEEGAAAGLARYGELRESYGDRIVAENLLNAVGYALLNDDKTAEAIEAFRLNVEMYPSSSNAYDSLGEGYMVSGDRVKAIENYEKSLELNADNANAEAKLAELRAR
jgi:tetratricopeptide (TPR) repeat protein